MTPPWRALHTCLVVSEIVIKDLCGSWVQKLSLGAQVDNTVVPKCYSHNYSSNAVQIFGAYAVKEMLKNWICLSKPAVCFGKVQEAV